jgi:nitroimidazol reductase NimA-like FMN-containing flavoprotein (pyridoxamine 5'-phosphate oxidase superfamily)
MMIFDIMLGKLNNEQIEVLLNDLPIGRIGCHADGVTYVVPVNYVYDGDFIYAHSGEGLKINIMRKNPEVCFQLDKIENMFNWQSVICWGTFEELTGIQETQDAMMKLIAKVEPYLSKSDDAHPSHGITDKASDIEFEKELILYRIKLTKKTGRFENREMLQPFSQER